MDAPSTVDAAFNVVASATLSLDQRAAEGATQAHTSLGRLHAVPSDGVVVGSSGEPAETLYRGFEIAVALFGLIVGLPLMLIWLALAVIESSQRNSGRLRET